MGVIREALVERVQPDVAAAVKEAIDVRNRRLLLETVTYVPRTALCWPPSRRRPARSLRDLIGSMPFSMYSMALSCFFATYVLRCSTSKGCLRAQSKRNPRPRVSCPLSSSPPARCTLTSCWTSPSHALQYPCLLRSSYIFLPLLTLLPPNPPLSFSGLSDDDGAWGGGHRGFTPVPPRTVRGVLRYRLVRGVGEPGQI